MKGSCSGHFSPTALSDLNGGSVVPSQRGDQRCELAWVSVLLHIQRVCDPGCDLNVTCQVGTRQSPMPGSAGTSHREVMHRKPRPSARHTVGALLMLTSSMTFNRQY